MVTELLSSEGEREKGGVEGRGERERRGGGEGRERKEGWRGGEREKGGVEGRGDGGETGERGGRGTSTHLKPLCAAIAPMFITFKLQ